MKTIKTLHIAMLFGCLSLFPAFTSAETFYKWVDEQGTTHYGSKPSEEHSSTPVHTSGRPSGPASKMAPSAKNENSKETDSDEGSVAYDAEEMAKYCKSIKERLDLMIAKNQIKQRNKDGSVVMLTEEQRQKQIADLKKRMAENCK